MKKYLFITIDTEEDLWGGYKINKPPTENIKELPNLQDIFNKYNAIPTYLVNYPVASSDFATDILTEFLNRGQCEIGTHCHPWNTPPFVEELNEYNSFMSNLPAPLIQSKMDNLHKIIRNRLKIDPVVFRAGRLGLNGHGLKIIKNLGYKIDTSVTPFTDWMEYSGPNFNLDNTSAYGLNHMKYLCTRAEKCNSCLRKGTCMVEIPPTIGFLQKNFKFCNQVRTILKKKPYKFFRLIGILDKLKILNYRWLSPELSTYEDMVRLTKRFISNGHRFLNMSFHSTSLLPGKTPFVKNENDLNRLLSDIDDYLRFTSKNQISCVGMSTVLEIIS